MRLETADGVRCRAVDDPTIDPWSSTDTKASRSVKFIFPPLTCLLFGCTDNPGRFHKCSSKWSQFACCANCASKHFMVRIVQNMNLDWHVTGLRRRLTLFGHRRQREDVPPAHFSGIQICGLSASRSIGLIRSSYSRFSF